MASELARRAGMSRAEMAMAGNAGLLADLPEHRLTFRFVAPILFGNDGASREPAFARYVMQAIEVAKAADRTLGLRVTRDGVPDIVATAGAVVNAYEPYLGRSDDPAESVTRWLRRRREEGLHSRKAFAAFASLPRVPRTSLVNAASRVGAYPAIALKAMRVAASEDASLRQLAAIAEQDQVLAACLVAAANSALNPTKARIAAIDHAITYIGLVQTRRVLAAAAMRPLFASQHLRELWTHSLTVAAWCESLAPGTGLLAADQAFLCGLVHDVGRLAMLTAPGEAPETLQRLTEAGSDPCFAELLLFGSGHGSIGANILDAWRFPPDISAAVANHHDLRGALSPMSAMIYLAESAHGERTPSMTRDDDACQILGIGKESVSTNSVELGALGVLVAA